MRVVLDSNVWVAAATNRGTAFALVERLQAAGSTLLISPFMLKEIERTLSGKKFVEYRRKQFRVRWHL